MQTMILILCIQKFHIWRLCNACVMQCLQPTIAVIEWSADYRDTHAVLPGGCAVVTFTDNQTTVGDNGRIWRFLAVVIHQNKLSIFICFESLTDNLFRLFFRFAQTRINKAMTRGQWTWSDKFISKMH